MREYITLLFLSSIITIGYSQKNFSPIEKLNFENTNKELIFSRLDTLFSQIKRGNVDHELIYNEDPFTKAELESLVGYDKFEKKLINLYPISATKFSLTFAFFNLSKNLNCMYNLICVVENQTVTFHNVLYENTKDWKKEVVGNITYYYKNKIDKQNALNFNTKNEVIAKKFNLPAEKFNFYLTENYQQILNLLGYQYDAQENGKYRDGYGVSAHTIFAIQGNEDFSHDIFHYYSGKINKVRNHITEEGVAYLWGNAYYTDKNKEMIELPALVKELKNYLITNPNQSILELFEKDIKIFNDIASEISVRSTISALLMKEVEKKNGIAGVSKMITCGEKMAPYLKELENQLNINRENFNVEVKKIIEAYN